MKRVAGTIISDVDKTYYGKFIRNEEQIRSLAAANPNSYAAVVVRSVDHLLTAKALMNEHTSQPCNPCCTETILHELSSSFRASELFGLWTPDLLLAIKSMANESMYSEGSTTSRLDRDARICLVVLNQTDMEEKISFANACRRKYPKEVLFQRIYSDLFTYTQDWTAGLQASKEVSELFPTDADVLNSRAGILRLAIVNGRIDCTNRGRQKELIEALKEAYKNYFRFAPKDHRFFASNCYARAFLSLTNSNPSLLLSHSELQDISQYFVKGQSAEMDILPCFLPFNSSHKEYVARIVNVHPTTCMFAGSEIDMTHGTPNGKCFPSEILNLINMDKPSQRRIDVCVPHRRRLKTLVGDAGTDDCEMDVNQNMDIASVYRRTDDYEEIILHQMTLAKVSKKFAMKVIQLTVVENSIFCGGMNDSGYHIETIVADTTGDVIKLQLDLGAERPSFETLKRLMNRFRFGTDWKLLDPHFHVESGDDSGMYIRATTEQFIPITNGCYKCRMCFKTLSVRKICSKCKVAAYCGEVCQKQDWKYLKHRLICSNA